MNKNQFLISLYKISGLDTEFRFDREDIIKELSIDEKTVDRFSNYWVNKGYLHGPSKTTIGSHMCLFFEVDGLDYVESLIEKSEPKKNEAISTKIEIFISHSKLDLDLAKALVKLLLSSLSIQKDQIRCTSVPGHKFEAGIDTDEKIRQEIHETSCLVGLITPNSLASSYVLFELGARWGINKYLIPLLGKGANYEDLPVPIRNKNAIMLDSESEVYDLLESIAKEVNVKLERISSSIEELNKVVELASKKTPVEKKADDGRFSANSIKNIIALDAKEIISSKERRKILGSEEGVKLANKSGNDFFQEFEKACIENEHLSANISFGLKKTKDLFYEWQSELKTRNATAIIKFKIPFENSNIGYDNYESTFISIYAANYYLFDGYSRSNKKNDVVYERKYYFNIDGNGNAAWTETNLGSNFISTKSLVNESFLEFYNFSRSQKDM